MRCFFKEDIMSRFFGAKKLNRIYKFGILGVAGVLAMTIGVKAIEAGRVATEEPIAGINTSLDKLVVAEAQTGAAGSIASSYLQTAQAVTDAAISYDEQVSDVVTDQVNDELAEAPDEHVKLNLNYDRLGIAKVDTYLNVRKKPSESSKVVGKLTKHAGCHIYKIKKGWAKIVSGKVKGYVKASYLVTDEKAEKMAMKVGTKMATVLSEGLRVRALPSTDSAIYDVLGQDEDFEIYRENLSKEWLDKFISKHIKKKQLKGLDYDAMCSDLSNWICVSIDDGYAFVAKEFVEISFKLNRAVKIGDIATDGSDGVSSTRASIVEYAKQFLGNRYVYGGTSLTGGIDCSGFTMRIYQHFGYSIPRDSRSQASALGSVSGKDVRPGDLFFYSNGSRINHVAMYIGSGMIIHASNPRTGIKISNAYYRSPVKIARVVRD